MTRQIFRNNIYAFWVLTFFTIVLQSYPANLHAFRTSESIFYGSENQLASVGTAADLMFRVHWNVRFQYINPIHFKMNRFSNGYSVVSSLELLKA